MGNNAAQRFPRTDTPRLSAPQGLAGPSKSTHPFARVYISEPFPTTHDDERGKQTSVVWQSSDPVWDEALLFRDVCAAAELAVELWDLGGTRSTAQLNRLAQNPSGEGRGGGGYGQHEQVRALCPQPDAHNQRQASDAWISAALKASSLSTHTCTPACSQR